MSPSAIFWLQMLALGCGVGLWVGAGIRCFGWLERVRFDWVVAVLLLLGLPLVVFAASGGWPLMPEQYRLCEPHCLP